MDTSNDPQHNSPTELGLSASTASADSPLQPPPPEPVLDEQQRRALEWLNEPDATVIDAAEFAGVSRSTFYRWVDNDPNFRVLYLAWLQKQMRASDGQVF